MHASAVGGRGRRRARGSDAAAAAAAAAARDRIDSALAEASGLKAELHGASLERSALTEEAARLRRRCEAAEERLGSVTSELHALRAEHEEAR